MVFEKGIVIIMFTIYAKMITKRISIILIKKGNEEMNDKDGDFAKGCLIGIGLSIPVWAFVIWVLFKLF